MIKPRIQSKKNTENVFEPFTISLEIRSEAELCNLWHRFNISTTDVEAAYEGLPDANTKLKYFASGARRFWTTIDREVAKRDLKNKKAI